MPESERSAGPEEVHPTVAGVEVEDLGVLPTVVAEINAMADKPATTAEQVAAMILRDPTLTSKLLRIVNSAYYGLRREIESIAHAVAYLGIHQIRNLVVSSALIESFRFDHGFVEPYKVWQHSLGCAIGAKTMGDRIPGLNGDSAYLGGLLHDIGRIVFLSKFPQRFADAVNNCERGFCTLREAEETQFELSHEEAGETIGSAWGFSSAVASIIRWHHAPERAGEMAPFAAIVAFSNAVCHERGLRFGFEVDDENSTDEKEHAWRVLLSTHPPAERIDRTQVEEAVTGSIERTRALVEHLF